MTPQDFVRKWQASTLKERSAAQEHFIDLCRMLDEPTPAEADPHGDFFCFERPVSKTLGGDGSADVWKRGCFAWEYKGKHRDLHAAYAQLHNYAASLEHPPLLIVSDMEIIRIHTHFTNSVQQIHEIRLLDLLDADRLSLLKKAFQRPEALKPDITREALTAEAAGKFGDLAQTLRDRKHEPHRVAHFVTRLLFCLFAEDIDLLPERLFTRLLESARKHPQHFQQLASNLFAAMHKGGPLGLEIIDWFNGGLFDNGDALPLESRDISLLLDCARLDWSAIEPSIFGTLFERGLDPDKRSQLGAHYTDRDSILKIVEPVVLQPLRDEWADVRKKIEAKVAGKATTRAFNDAKRIYEEFLAKLRATRVLDPACGSGNFLYLALIGLKDLEREVIDDASSLLRIARTFPEADPRNVLGIEVNPYAAELARVTIWIGQIQWMLRHNFNLNKNPVLQPLDQIECRDALLTETGAEASWPATDCIVGNPPFLGDKKMISGLGEDYVKQLRKTYQGRVPGGADLVTYWFEKARWQMEHGHAKRAGLVATNSIRGGQNRKVLERITNTGSIFEAWSDEPWVLDGAAVRVSLVCFANACPGARLDGSPVSEIHPDLTSSLNLATAVRLTANAELMFMGTTKVGSFDIRGERAREWLQLPLNPNGRPNSDVVRPWWNSLDVTRRCEDKWVIDFGSDMTDPEAAMYEAPFEYVRQHVMPARLKNRRAAYAKAWWRHGESRPKLRTRLRGKSRYIATPSVAKHRIFIYLNIAIVPDHQIFALTRDDDTTFGILHSRFHEAWALRQGTSLEDRPRYTPTTTFETFPFPDGLTPDIPAADYADDPRAIAIAEAARELNTLRENWLNPPDLVHRVPEVVPGFPDRILPNDAKAAEILKKRTLTNLYNQRPAWLQNVHAKLDAAVAAAYGWPAGISTGDALAKLLALNHARAGR